MTSAPEITRTGGSASRRWKLAAIGAAAGMLMAATFGAMPASAAKPPAKPGQSEPVAGGASYSCATFESLVVSEDRPGYSGIALTAGETVTAHVTPYTAGDQISLHTTLGLNFVFSASPAEQGHAFTAPVDGVYSLGWALVSAGTVPTGLTWTFDCSSTTGGEIADLDGDGVTDTLDACAATTLPDTVTKKAAGRYYANAAGQFVDGAGVSAAISVVDTGGCSASQIAAASGLAAKDSKSGIPLSLLTSWASTH